MNKVFVIILCCLLAIPAKGMAYSMYGEENPFVEAMLRMMEIFGLIDRDRLPLGVPYLPTYGQYLSPGLGTLGSYPLTGLGGLPGGIPGAGGVPGLSPLSGFGGAPMLSGLGGLPAGATVPGLGMSGLPYGMPPGGGWPPGSWGVPGNQTWYQGQPLVPRGRLDGIWELENGTFVIIQGEMARLYLSQQRYQDFAIRYDRQHLSWKPLQGTSASTYRYRARDGRMILSDEDGKILLLRRRR